MKIVAKVKKESLELVDSLNKRGINAKLARNGVVIELPNDEVSGKYEIPAEAQDAILFIDCTESGGGYTNTGSATVVCGLSGKALRPYLVSRSGHRACDTHAYFSVPCSVITVTGYRKQSNIEIVSHTIIRDGNIARIESKSIWSGDFRELPKIFERYEQAVFAANKKADCYHCRHVHYAEIEFE